MQVSAYHYIVIDGHSLEKRQVLKCSTESERCTTMRRQRQDVAIGKVNSAFICAITSRYYIHQRRLSGAIRSNKSEYVPPPQIKRHIISGCYSTEQQ